MGFLTGIILRPSTGGGLSYWNLEDSQPHQLGNRWRTAIILVGMTLDYQLLPHLGGEVSLPSHSESSGWN